MKHIALIIIALAAVVSFTTESKTIMQQIFVCVKYLSIVITAYVVVRLLK